MTPGKMRLTVAGSELPQQPERSLVLRLKEGWACKYAKNGEGGMIATRHGL